MGQEIIFVMLLNVGLPRNDLYIGLSRISNIGVDMFFFLSGIGLWYSWAKDSSTNTFYLKRIFRIYPTWLIVATAYYVSDMFW
ncbi:UNVERIFIED_CONTAM: acyltransferase family protein, partial [Prevotella sp. 15_C9]